MRLTSQRCQNEGKKRYLETVRFQGLLAETIAVGVVELLQHSQAVVESLVEVPIVDSSVAHSVQRALQSLEGDLPHL